ncbi:MAG: hypothetical protein D6782_13560, partial [Alphaproteobacteria bacterium]
ASTADGLVIAAHEAAAKVGAEVGDVAGQLGERLAALESLARDNREQIESLSEGLAARIDALAGVASQARAQLDAANTAIDAQTASASAAFARMGSELGALERQIAERRDNLVRLGGDVTDRIAGALDQLGAQAKAIGSQVEDSAIGLSAENQRLGEQLAAMRDAFGQAMAQTHDAVDAFRQASEDLGAFAAGNVGQLGAATDRLQSLSGESEKIQQAVTAMTQTMTAEIDKIRAAVRDAGDAADQGAVQVGATYLSAMARSRKISADAVDAARAAAQDVVKMVEDTVAKTLETLRAQGGAQSAEAEQALSQTAARISQSLNETLSQVGLAATRASVTAESAARRVASQAEGLLKETHDLANKMSAMEARLDTVVRSDLVRTSSLIIEGLNAAAVDIGRVLATDISDAQWQQYLS